MRKTAFNKCYNKRAELENFISLQVQEEVKHFCKQNNLEFISANGVAFFFNRNKDDIENKKTEKFLEMFWELGVVELGQAPWTGWYNSWADEFVFHWTKDPWKDLR